MSTVSSDSSAVLKLSKISTYLTSFQLDVPPTQPFLRPTSSSAHLGYSTNENAGADSSLGNQSAVSQSTATDKTNASVGCQSDVTWSRNTISTYYDPKHELFTTKSLKNMHCWRLPVHTLSVYVCVRRGWYMTNADMLACSDCRELLSLTLPCPSNKESYERAVQLLQERVHSKHLPTCRWRTSPAPLAWCRPPPLLEPAAVYQLVQLAHNLSKNFSRVPYLESSGQRILNHLGIEESTMDLVLGVGHTQALRTALLLLLCGWKEDHLSIPCLMSLRCELCKRRLSLAFFRSVPEHDEVLSLDASDNSGAASATALTSADGAPAVAANEDDVTTANGTNVTVSSGSAEKESRSCGEAVRDVAPEHAPKQSVEEGSKRDESGLKKGTEDATIPSSEGISTLSSGSGVPSSSNFATESAVVDSSMEADAGCKNLPAGQVESGHLTTVKEVTSKVEEARKKDLPESSKSEKSIVSSHCTNAKSTEESNNDCSTKSDEVSNVDCKVKSCEDPDVDCNTKSEISKADCGAKSGTDSDTDSRAKSGEVSSVDCGTKSNEDSNAECSSVESQETSAMDCTVGQQASSANRSQNSEGACGVPAKRKREDDSVESEHNSTNENCLKKSKSCAEDHPAVVPGKSAPVVEKTRPRPALCPLQQHQPWCAWLGPARPHLLQEQDAPCDEEDLDTSGCRVLARELQTVARRASPTRWTQTQKYRTSVNAVRSVRSLLSSWLGAAPAGGQRAGP